MWRILTKTRKPNAKFTKNEIIRNISIEIKVLTPSAINKFIPHIYRQLKLCVHHQTHEHSSGHFELLSLSKVIWRHNQDRILDQGFDMLIVGGIILLLNTKRDVII